MAELAHQELAIDSNTFLAELDHGMQCWVVIPDNTIS
jgi:hypothetical protein